MIARVPSTSEAGAFNILIPAHSRMNGDHLPPSPQPPGACVSSLGHTDSSLGPQGPGTRAAQSSVAASGRGLRNEPWDPGTCSADSNHQPGRSAGFSPRKLPGHHSSVPRGRRPAEITTTINQRLGPEQWKKCEFLGWPLRPARPVTRWAVTSPLRATVCSSGKSRTYLTRSQRKAHRPSGLTGGPVPTASNQPLLGGVGGQRAGPRVLLSCNFQPGGNFQGDTNKGVAVTVPTYQQ